MAITLAELAKDWLRNSADYRPSAFWFWNDRMDTERMREVVVEMAEKGIREFLIHPVHGMEIEYLSEEFFERYRYALDLAKEHGLKVWIYDEFGWPSGNAGGLLLREHPEHNAWFLDFSRNEPGNVVAEPKQSDRILDDTMGAPWTRNEAGYLDTLSESAVRCFIEMTHERMYRECGDLFQEVIAGFFTDEPTCMMDLSTGADALWFGIGLPWTPSLPTRFEERFGYDIEPHYAELAGDGPNPMKRDYWELVKEMYSEAYHGQIGRWCREHGVKYTGHVGEDLPLMQVRFSGSVFQCLRHMDEPGIDYLGAGLEPDSRFVEEVLVPSIARHAGKERVYCEAYGVSPLDIRLGGMLGRAQMFGINGINDIALMGFQQSLDGIRKRTYWPPLFMESPWWEFYPEYRDAVSRSVSLAALGIRKSRYAILYPQNELEQTDLFNADVTSLTDPGSRMPQTLGAAIYESGESFEFIFPEILSEANVVGGRIVFPHAEYETILAPSDIRFFEDSVVELDRLQSDGGNVLRETLDELVKTIKNTKASWGDRLNIGGDADAGDIRIFRFQYPDGELFALRNTSENARRVILSSSCKMSEWDAVSGGVTQLDSNAEHTILPHSTEYVALSDKSLGERVEHVDTTSIPLNAKWHIETEGLNMARPIGMQFYHEKLGWIDATDTTPWWKSGDGYLTGIPAEFRGETRIKMRGTFQTASIPHPLGILFEAGHLDALEINGRNIDLSKAVAAPVWDKSCSWVPIDEAVVEGENKVTGILVFGQFETEFFNHAFFNCTPMPSCDLAVIGNFRLLSGVVSRDDDSRLDLPIDFSRDGWEEFDGILRASTSIQIDQDLAVTVRGISVESVSEDAIELLWDGKSIGRQIVRPYHFPLEDVQPGCHTLTLRISGTSANILGNPSPWGIQNIAFTCR